MSAPPIQSGLLYRMATSLNKAWADWFVALGQTQDSLGTMATQDANNVAITGGSIGGIADLAIQDGGTGASTAAGARANIGAAGLADANAFSQLNDFSTAGIALPSGTFTPTLISSGGGTPTYSVQVGRYTRIGNRVSFVANVTITAYGTMAAGNLTLGGLPFTSDGTSNNANVCSFMGNNMAAAAATSLQAQVLAGSSVVSLYRFAAGARTPLARADITTSALFRVAGIYEV